MHCIFTAVVGIVTGYDYYSVLTSKATS